MIEGDESGEEVFFYAEEFQPAAECLPEVASSGDEDFLADIDAPSDGVADAGVPDHAIVVIDRHDAAPSGGDAAADGGGKCATFRRRGRPGKRQLPPSVNVVARGAQVCAKRSRMELESHSTDEKVLNGLMTGRMDGTIGQT